jgi:polysaccharide export outer membrane protein
MRNNFIKNIYTILGLALLTIVASSCGTTKDAVYFANIDSTKFHEVPVAQFKEPLIQTDDILNITIQTLEVGTSTAVDQTSAVATGSISGDKAPVSGFLVDKAGNIELPIMGVVKVAGLTTFEAKEALRSKAEQYYKSPTIQVRFANYKITVLGEVLKPAAYTVPYEKVTVLDAIALAGDLTIYGKRKNVMLIRDNGEKKDIIRLDLTSTALISSPYYYLKQNDVIYVEPTKGKVAVNNTATNKLITIGFSAAALLLSIIRIL